MRLEDFDNDEDKVIQDRLKHKTWNEIKTNDSWAIFKIMSEFVNGYDIMARIGPCVTIFGSARTCPDQHYYELAEKIIYLVNKYEHEQANLNVMRSNALETAKHYQIDITEKALLY